MRNLQKIKQLACLAQYRQHDESDEMPTHWGTFGNVRSSVEGALILGVWTRAGLRTSDLAILAWMSLKLEFRWHSVMSVQEKSVPNGRFNWSPAPL